MAEKQASVYVVDLGRSMGRKHNGRSQTDLEYAMQYVWDKITSTIANGRKTDTVGVLGFRTDGTDNDMMEEDDGYEHITVLNPISQFFMPDLRKLQGALIPSKTNKGDGISAICIAIQMIMTYCKKLKYIRNICLVTDGMGDFDPDDMDNIRDQIKAEGINLTILGVDFDDEEFGFIEEGKSDGKAKAESVLRKLCSEVDGVFGTLQEAINELGNPRLKKTRPVASFKGDLTLGDPSKYENAFVINVERYPRTMIAKPVSASAYVLKPESGEAEGGSIDGIAFDGSNSNLQAVKQTRSYQVDDDSAFGGKMDIDKDQMEKGYSYGREVVPISTTDETITLFETEPGLQIIGFVPADKYQRYFSMSNTNVVVGSKGNPKAFMALSSLIHALFELESYALARLVKKKDAPPLMVMLAPLIDADFECLIDVEVPFAEDVRAYKFAPLDKVKTVTGKVLDKHRNIPTTDVERAMSDYVDSMDLATFNQDDEGNPSEYATPEDTFSPIVHRINQVIRWRAVHPEDPIPDPYPVLTKYSNPPDELLEKIQTPLDSLIAVCDIKKVPLKVAGRKGRREQPVPKSGLDVESLLASSGPASATTPAVRKQAAISTNNAIPEFKRKLGLTEDLDELKSAGEEMLVIMKELITHSLADTNYGRVCEMLKVMRQEYIDFDEPGVYNEVVGELKRAIHNEELNGDREDMWMELRINKLGLVTRGESDRVAVEEEDAKKFLWN